MILQWGNTEDWIWHNWVQVDGGEKKGMAEDYDDEDHDGDDEDNGDNEDLGHHETHNPQYAIKVGDSGPATVAIGGPTSSIALDASSTNDTDSDRPSSRASSEDPDGASTATSVSDDNTHSSPQPQDDATKLVRSSACWDLLSGVLAEERDAIDGVWQRMGPAHPLAEMQPHLFQLLPQHRRRGAVVPVRDLLNADMLMKQGRHNA
jgi:hypothetical protein